MKYFMPIMVAVVSIVCTVLFHSLLNNRDKPSPYDAQEVFTRKCIERDGNPVIKRGFKDGMSVNEFQCNGVEKNKEGVLQ